MTAVGAAGGLTMRIGIFGGSFDPVHYGHLILAEQCREQGRLDQVWFVPAPRPPQKQEDALTPFAQRVEMLALAVAGHPAFRVDELEKDRPGPSYTADTLEEIHRRLPDAELFLLLGSDSLRDLPQWYDPARIVQHASLLVMARPGSAVDDPAGYDTLLQLPPGVRLRLEVVDVPQIDISSRDLRRRVRQQRSIRYFLPRAVEAYIQEKRLYQARP
jgi:nicotinate-nucleotide adenylyltransferase